MYAVLRSSQSPSREQLGVEVADSANRSDVLLPLSKGLLYAESGDGREAVLNAGNAVESHLDNLGSVLGVSLTGATGVNAKLDKFSRAGRLPKKHIHVGKYLGHVRNAADHGIDPDLGASYSGLQ